MRRRTDKNQSGKVITDSGEILLYRTPDGTARLSVQFEKETIWLDAHQMGVLFDRDRSVVLRHIRNIYASGELDAAAPCAKIAQVAADGKTRRMDIFNLDVIIGVGYRVNSLRGTQFRIWATQVLKDHLIQGYTVNERRLREQNKRLMELQQTVALMGRVVQGRELERAEAAGLLHVITDYSYALTLLDQYDHQDLKISKTTRKKPALITYEESRHAIDTLGRQFRVKGPPSTLFGKEKDASFKSSLGAIYQTCGGKELYPSIEEKAAHLLYFVVKNHSFVDGNKRIGAFLFVWFLDNNGILYTQDGKKRLGDNALVALTLMIAESRPRDKDIITKVIVNLINRDNV
jgi:prophage maintenance system killer protein